MEFNRPPRIQQSVEPKKILIPAAKSLPNKPQTNWWTLGLPLAGTMLAVGLMVAFYGSTSGMSILFFLPLVLASVVASVITSFQDKSKYRKQVADEKSAYSAALDRKETELAALVASHQRVEFENNPDVAVCRQWARDGFYRLGERRPEDADFLSFRIGVGRQQAPWEIHGPSEEGRDEVFTEEYARADNLKARFSSVERVPIIANLLAAGSVGVSGPREKCRDLARAALVHLTAHHWYQEVSVGIVVDSIGSTDDWNWLNGLPHGLKLFDSAVVDMTRHSSKGLESLETELHRRRAFAYHRQVVSKGEAQQTPMLPAIVIVLDNLASFHDHAAISLILREGRQLGVYGIVLVDRFENIPGECGAAIEIIDNVSAYKEVGVGKAPLTDIFQDESSLADTQGFAKSLAGIDWPMRVNLTGPPARVGLLEMFGASGPENLAIEAYWDGNHPYGYLRAPIGRMTPSADLIFDLNESGVQQHGTGGYPSQESHGPHGVIGGMTGSGKSELLRTMILALALSHHPYDINFALIDYKGGGAFRDLEDLPHVVGLITDIENHANYAGRVIQALNGEIKVRKQILAEAQLSSGLRRPHIDDYRQLPVKRPLPRLIIIFDEFAEFKDRHPEESRQLINIARQGRSLGVHLILCTQNPAAAIDEQVRQNSKFTISLAVNSPDDSRSLIGIPDAFGLEPGRAFIHVSNPQEFQVAFSGNTLGTGPFEGKTEARAIVEALQGAASKLKIETPSRVWPDPLAERVYLPSLLEGMEDSGIASAWRGTDWDRTAANWVGYVLGRYDDPIHQSQPLYIMGNSSAGNNLLILGASQSGKSTLLLTLAIGIARAHTPKQAHIYCLDLGGRSQVYKIKDLPHVPEEGGVINGSDRERIGSLFSYLRRQIQFRKLSYQQSDGISPDHRVHYPIQEQAPPAIYLLIDGLTARFAESMDNFNDQLAEIILEGQSLGISVALTANVFQDVNFKISSYISNRLILRPTEKTQVDSISEGTPSHLLEMVLRPDLPPGRGLLGGRRALEFQAALPTSGLDDEEQSYYLATLISSMAKAWGALPRPPKIRVLPSFITLEDLDREIKAMPPHDGVSLPDIPLGLGREARPLGISLESDGPCLLVTSNAPLQGKTTFVQTLLIQLASRYTPAQLKLLVVDFHSHSMSPFAELAHAKGAWFISRHEQLEPALGQLKKEIIQRGSLLEQRYQDARDDYEPQKFLRERGYLFIVIDDYNAFRLRAAPSARDLLRECVVLGEDCGVRLLIAETGALLGSPHYDDLLMQITKSGCGISLGGADNLDTYYSQAKIGVGEKSNEFPAGRGYLVVRRTGHLVQLAMFGPRGADRAESLRQRLPQADNTLKGR